MKDVDRSSKMTLNMASARDVSWNLLPSVGTWFCTQGLPWIFLQKEMLEYENLLQTEVKDSILKCLKCSMTTANHLNTI